MKTEAQGVQAIQHCGGTVPPIQSSDATITTEDTEVRTALVGALGSGKLTTTWAILPTPFSVGTYYYGACIESVESEFDTTNNCSDAIEITVEPRGTEKPTLTPIGTIPTQELEVGGSALVLNVSGYFFGEVETWTASSNKTEVVTVGMSGSEVTLTSVGEGWATVTVQASSGDLAAKQTFSVSVGNPSTPDPHVSDTQEPNVIDTSPEVLIPDVNLRARIRERFGLAEGDTITQQKMQELTSLYFDRNPGINASVGDLTGLEHATNLRALNARNNHIRDITPLANLTALTQLLIAHNYISDITPIQNLTSLVSLDLAHNHISDITPLKDLTALTRLYLYSNGIGNITPLQNLTALEFLTIGANGISDLTPLTRLTQLDTLSLISNGISDITPLQNLTALTKLYLNQNQITDVTPLENLANLTNLRIYGNPIEDLAPLRRLKAANPNVNIDIDINAGQAPSAPVLPAETSLFPNYPNPFNPETWIPYQLAKTADVTVTIYDFRGVVVRRLALGHRPPGSTIVEVVQRIGMAGTNSARGLPAVCIFIRSPQAISPRHRNS